MNKKMTQMLTQMNQNIGDDAGDASAFLLDDPACQIWQPLLVTIRQFHPASRSSIK